MNSLRDDKKASVKDSFMISEIGERNTSDNIIKRKRLIKNSSKENYKQQKLQHQKLPILPQQTKSKTEGQQRSFYSKSNCRNLSRLQISTDQEVSEFIDTKIESLSKNQSVKLVPIQMKFNGKKAKKIEKKKVKNDQNKESISDYKLTKELKKGIRPLLEVLILFISEDGVFSKESQNKLKQIAAFYRYKGFNQDDNGNFSCKHCNAKFKTQSKGLRHMTLHWHYRDGEVRSFYQNDKLEANERRCHACNFKVNINNYRAHCLLNCPKYWKLPTVIETFYKVASKHPQVLVVICNNLQSILLKEINNPYYIKKEASINGITVDEFDPQSSIYKKLSINKNIDENLQNNIFQQISSSYLRTKKHKQQKRIIQDNSSNEKYLEDQKLNKERICLSKSIIEHQSYQIPKSLLERIEDNLFENEGYSDSNFNIIDNVF